MAGPRLILAAGLALLGFAAAAPAAGAALSAATMYEPETVVAIQLGLDDEALAELEADPDEYVEGTFALHESDGTPAGIDPEPVAPGPLTVGVRLKGSTSFEGLDGKAAFKVKFDEFEDGQTFLGLEKLTLNNMVQDPSMLHEALAYETFAAAGVPAPRAGYAYVRLNGVDYGLHLNLETLDKVALARHFGPFSSPPQHLYEGVPQLDLLPGAAAGFEVDEGKSGDRADLEALIAAANAGSPSFTPRLEPVAELEEMVRMWAAERFLAQWDGYSGTWVNNYYLHSSATGVFQMLPWGTDQALVNWSYSFTGRGGTLFVQCLAEAACRSDYEAALAEVAAAAAALDLPARAQALADLLAPWQGFEAEQSTRAPFEAAEIAAGVEDTLEFLARRPGLLASWLGEEPEGPGEEKEEGGGGPPAALPVDPATITLHPFDAAPRAPQPISISNRLELDRARLGRGLLIVRVATTGPGTVSLSGAAGAGGERRVCAPAPRRSVSGGGHELRCRLTEAARLRLAARPLAVRLTVSFRPADGGPESTVTRLARLPREARWAAR